jgi:hypothetical protein
MPRPAPVMIATLPTKRMIYISKLFTADGHGHVPFDAAAQL